MNRPEIERITINLVELCEDSVRDQACAHGARADTHAVYCHNGTWADAPRKCWRTWYTGGEVRDEDCAGFEARVLALPPEAIPATRCRAAGGMHETTEPETSLDKLAPPAKEKA